MSKLVSALTNGSERRRRQRLQGRLVYAGIEGATIKDCTEVFGNDEACDLQRRQGAIGFRF